MQKLRKALKTWSKGCLAGFSSLGERGKRAEDVAKEAVDALVTYLESDGCLDSHLADQIFALCGPKQRKFCIFHRIVLPSPDLCVQNLLSARLVRGPDQDAEHSQRPQAGMDTVVVAADQAEDSVRLQEARDDVGRRAIPGFEDEPQ
jgi:hypothetical protein